MDINVSEYEAQLKQVDQALLAITDPAERTELETLKSSLVELIELTKEPATSSSATTADSTNESDREMHRFLNEIKEIDAGKPEAEVLNSDAELLDVVKEDLEEMVGKKCSAPHMHAWGAVGYHNAIVCGIVDEIDVNEDGTFDVQVRVLFTNPTHREMLPCSYYLEGECRFDAERCHFSHGELVSVNKLREYSAPDFEQLARNCIVLAKLPDRLWYRGRVICVNFVEKICRVRLDGQEHKERERDFPFEDLFPISNDDDESDSSQSDSSESASDSEELDDYEEARRARLIEQSLFSYKPTQPLGEWEKHTRGIGSKLMEKMGYIHGTGLGSDGRGIITPVSAQILPQGRSLDHCMELREAANGDNDLFSVERKLQRQKKKQEDLNQKAYQRESQKTDVFTFLNGNIFSNESPQNSAVVKTKPSLKEHTNKSLNVASVRVADDIRRKEREITKVQASIKRHSTGTEIHKQLQTQLNARNQELMALQREEQSLSKEQTTRKTTNKLTVF